MKLKSDCDENQVGMCPSVHVSLVRSSILTVVLAWRRGVSQIAGCYARSVIHARTLLAAPGAATVGGSVPYCPDSSYPDAVTKQW